MILLIKNSERTWLANGVSGLSVLLFGKRSKVAFVFFQKFYFIPSGDIQILKNKNNLKLDVGNPSREVS